ncbi:MAG: hypothetical protein ABSC35_06275 [Candidatus Dormibacteria bacterium]|jgi:hypothetical protein
MADYETYVTDLQKQFLTAIQKLGEVQAKLIEAVRDVPATLESGQVTPSEMVEKSFDFVTQVLDTQRDLTLRLINAAGGTPTKTRTAKQAA